MIDPRGLLPDGRVSLFGDPRYDLAKLAHSALGNYDLIVAGRVSCVQNDQSFELDLAATRAEGWYTMQQAYSDSELARGITDPALLTAMQVQLFLSMLPLHKDRPSRQRTFLANAGHLFLSLKDL